MFSGSSNNNNNNNNIIITEFGTGIFQSFTGATSTAGRRKCRRRMSFSYRSGSHNGPAGTGTLATRGQFVQFLFVGNHFHFRQISFNSSHHLGLR